MHEKDKTSRHTKETKINILFSLFCSWKRCAYDIIRGYQEKDNYSKPIDSKIVMASVFPSIVMEKTEYEKEKVEISRARSIEILYRNSRRPFGKSLFIQTCRHIISFYNGYENTPSWFMSAIQDIELY